MCGKGQRQGLFAQGRRMQPHQESQQPRRTPLKQLVAGIKHEHGAAASGDRVLDTSVTSQQWYEPHLRIAGSARTRPCPKRTWQHRH